MSRRGIGHHIVCLLALAVLVVSCTAPQVVDPPPQLPSAAGAQFFRSPGSPWTRPVPAQARIDPDSAAYIKRIAALDPVISVRRFSVPVFLSDRTTRTYTVTPTADYTVRGYRMTDVPIPDQARPDPDDDGHMAVLDTSRQCVYEFYRAQRTGDGWTAEWANAIPADSTGVYPDGLSSRASGFSAAAGLIWPDELRDGRIPHALVFAYPFTRERVIVGDATRTDGRSRTGATLPIGAHLRLDPTINIDALGLPPTERTVAKALQEFGMVLADTSAGFTLYAAHPQSFSADPYPPLLGDVAYAGLSRLPFDRMQVLDLGPEKSRYTGPPIANRCNVDALREIGLS
jgi:hypothetical protein